MQWCPMLLNLRNKQPSLRQRSKQSLPAPTGRRPHPGKSVSHWNNPPQPLTRSYARLQGKLIYYRTCLRFRLVTQFMSCIESIRCFLFESVQSAYKIGPHDIHYLHTQWHTGKHCSLLQLMPCGSSCDQCGQCEGRLFVVYWFASLAAN